jgi:hypothetical protein
LPKSLPALVLSGAMSDQVAPLSVERATKTSRSDRLGPGALFAIHTATQ